MAKVELTLREIVEFARAPMRVLEKAIEERVLKPRIRTVASHGRRTRRVLGPHAVAYAAILSRLDLKLGLAHKRRLAANLARLEPDELGHSRLELSPAVEIDLGRLVGDAVERAGRYVSDRDAYIEINPEIKGGTPVIRGTRMTVYSVLGRVDGGDTIDEILEENPDLERAALEAAVVYARAHPFVGRPGGKPWKTAA
jgi:uncharacterized protein (DUF433 family)